MICIMSILDNYNVSIRKFFGEKVILTDEAKKEPVISNIIASIKDLDYTQEDIFGGLDIYMELVNKLKGNEEAEDYIKKNSVDNLGDIDRGYASVEEMGKAIYGLYSKLLNNIYVISSPRDWKEREEYYITLLKGFRLLGEIINENNLSNIELVGNLSMIADLDFVCASGWKDTLTELITMYRDKIQEKQPGKIKLSSEQDLIKTRLNDVFFGASDKVIKDLSYGFIELYNVPYGLRPHYIEIIRNYINTKYNLKIPNMDLEDNYMPEGSSGHKEVVKAFKEYVKDKSINELIVFEACRRYKEVLDSDYKARYEVVDWANGYLHKNAVKEERDGKSYFVLEKDGKKEEFDDVTDFLTQYVFCEDLQKVRKIAIEEIMRDKGYIKRNVRIKEASEYIEAMKIEKALKYSEREGELDVVESEIQDIINKKEVNNAVIFRAISNYENYGKIADMLLKEPLSNYLKDGMIVFMAKKNDVNRIKVLLKKNADINAKTGKKMNTPLIEAVECNNKEAMEILVKCGANINEKNNDYQNALAISALGGKYDVVKYLLDNGANVNEGIMDYIDIEGNIEQTNVVSKIRYSKENTKVIKLLIDKGADINVKSAKEDMKVLPIVKACLEDNMDIIKLLIENGQDLDAVDEAYSSRWFFEREDWLKLVNKNYKKCIKDPVIKNTLSELRQLKKACSKNDLKKVEEILRFNPCVGYRRVALKMLVDMENRTKFFERDKLKRQILDELEAMDGANYLEWAVNTKDTQLVNLLIKTQKISLHNLDDNNPKNLIKLAECNKNQDMINILHTHKSLMTQLKRNISRSKE